MLERVIIGKTYILVLAADHCPKTNISTETVSGLVGVDLLEDAVFVYTDILRVADAETLLSWLGFAAPIAYCCAAILTGGNGSWCRTLAPAGRAGNTWRM